jgi:hypothetical protein
MGIPNASPDVAEGRAGAAQWSAGGGPDPSREVEVPAPSERESMYQLAGTARGGHWPQVLVCFVPLVIFGSVEALTHVLRHIIRVDYSAWRHESTALDPATIELKSFGGSLASVVEDSSLRNALVLWSIAFFVLAVGAASTAWYVIFESLRQTKWRRLAMAGIAAFGGLVFFAMWHARAPGVNRLVVALQERVAAAMHVDRLQTLYAVMVASGNTVVGFASCAMCAALLPALLDAQSKPSDQADITFLGRRMRWMRALLYTVGAFFAVSTVVDYTAMDVVVVYLKDAGDQAAMQLMATRATRTFATLYSIILVCMYAPTEAILRIRASKIARDAHVRAAERASWLKERGLRLNALEQFKAVLAVLSPILVDLFRQSLTALVKGG